MDSKNTIIQENSIMVIGKLSSASPQLRKVAVESDVLF